MRASFRRHRAARVLRLAQQGQRIRRRQHARCEPARQIPCPSRNSNPIASFSASRGRVASHVAYFRGDALFANPATRFLNRLRHFRVRQQRRAKRRQLRQRRPQIRFRHVREFVHPARHQKHLKSKNARIPERRAVPRNFPAPRRPRIPCPPKAFPPPRPAFRATPPP